MATSPQWTNGLGFRQLIEDGLAILNGAPLGPDRQTYVLQDISEFVLQAKRGSDLVQNSALFVTSDDRAAYESFSLLDRYLGQTQSETWNNVLEQARLAFSELGKDKPQLREEQRAAAVSLLKRILAGLIREPKPGIPTQPEEFRIGA